MDTNSPTVLDQSQGSKSARDGETPRKRVHKLNSVELLVSGAVSGALAKSAIAPMDRLKILFQTNPQLHFSLPNLLSLVKEIYTKAGIRGFWRGHTATLVRVIPYSATNFYVFDRTRGFLNDSTSFSGYPLTLLFTAGALSGSAAVIVTYPFETLRARLAVDLSSQYKGYINAIIKIGRADGIRSLYSGLRPTLIGIIPYAGTSFAVYESLRTDEASFSKRLLIGALAGFSAQAATYPLDVVRRRMQVHPMRYETVISSFRYIYQQEGIFKGLFKGLSMNAVKGPIAVSISLTTNDLLKKYFCGDIS
jgi:solute carrier family 25 protein 42